MGFLPYIHVKLRSTAITVNRENDVKYAKKITVSRKKPVIFFQCSYILRSSSSIAACC